MNSQVVTYPVALWKSLKLLPSLKLDISVSFYSVRIELVLKPWRVAQGYALQLPITFSLLIHQKKKIKKNMTGLKRKKL